MMRRSRESGNTYWAGRLGEAELTAALSIEAGPPFAGPALGLGVAAALLLALGIFGLPESTLFLVGWIVFLGLSILTGGYVVRRAVATRWIEAIGSAPPMNMLLGVVADRLVIWQWPRRGSPPPGRVVDKPLTDVTLRPRMALLGGLDIQLSNGRTLFVNHSMGPNERQTIALILDAVADAGGRSDNATRPQS